MIRVGISLAASFFDQRQNEIPRFKVEVASGAFCQDQTGLLPNALAMAVSLLFTEERMLGEFFPLSIKSDGIRILSGLCFVGYAEQIQGGVNFISYGQRWE